MRIRSSAAVSMFVTLVLVAPAALAWTSIGPPGGEIDQIAFAGADGGRIYVAAGATLWVRTSEGEPFHEPNGGPLAGRIAPFAVDPADPLHLWRPGPGGTVLESRDGGASWNTLVILPDSAFVLDLAPDPWVPGAVDAAVRNRAGASVRGIVRVEPGGRWSLLLPTNSIQAMAAGPGTLYVATWDGFFRARWGGTLWDQAADPEPGVGRVLALAVDPEDRRHLLAATETGLASSEDGGTTWSRTGLPTGRIDHVAFGHGVAWCTAGNRLWVGRNGGRSWQLTGLGPAAITAVANDPARPDTVLVGTVGAAGPLGRPGLLRSDDSGATFRAADAGIVATRIQALSAGTGEGAPPLLVISSGQLLAWEGSAWRHVPIGDEETSAIARDPLDPARLLATSFVETDGYYGDALFVSSDGGRSWSQRTYAAPRFWFTELAADPYSPDRVFAAGIYGLAIFHPQTGGIDFVLTWADAFHTVAALQEPPGVVVAAGPGVWRSTDSGSSWTRVIEPEPAQPFYHLAAAASGPVYLLTDSGMLRRSGDGGASWRTVSSPGRRCTDLAVSPWDASELLAVCAEPAGGDGSVTWGLVWSLDGGRRWRRVSGPAGPRPFRAAFDPGRPGHVFVGTTAHGVWEGTLRPLVRPAGTRRLPTGPGGRTRSVPGPRAP